LLLELVQCRVKGALSDLQNLAGNLVEALRDRPTVPWLEGENL
jgi:hypothetical protein